MEKLRLYCFTSNEVTPTTRLYEVDSPRTGLIMIDAICDIWDKREIKIKHELSPENYRILMNAMKTESSLMPEEGAFFFPLINLEVFRDGEWEIWEDQLGDDIKQYEVENFDLLAGIR